MSLQDWLITKNQLLTSGGISRDKAGKTVGVSWPQCMSKEHLVQIICVILDTGVGVGII
jgi:hypothetical protein